MRRLGELASHSRSWVRGEKDFTTEITENTEMGRRTAEYTFSVISVVSVVNILAAPHGDGMNGG